MTQWGMGSRRDTQKWASNAGNLGEGKSRKMGEKSELLAPDYALLIQEIVDDFKAVAHLRLRLLGHGKNGSHQLA